MALNGSVRLKLIEKNINSQKLVDVGYPVFVKNTPVRSGNARRHTSRMSNEIDAAYPYAKRLDEGWSHQSPAGMVAPTIQAVREYIKKILGA